jgi:DNA segregation ATPase FtsK/SpoIIIE-like protein
MPTQPNPADQFSDEEMEQMKRYGAGQLGGTEFSAQVEKELAKFHQRREANAGKMREAQMGLAPSEMERAQVKQQGALQQQMATQGAQQAQQAQQGMIQGPPPQAPTGPAGTTVPYSAQAADIGPKETPETPASSGAPPSPPPAPGGQEEPPEGP